MFTVSEYHSKESQDPISAFGIGPHIPAGKKAIFYFIKVSELEMLALQMRVSSFKFHQKENFP